MIAKANINRPITVDFLRVYTSATGDMEITGVAQSLADINGYAQALRDDSTFSKVDLETSSKGGEAKFTLKIKFKK